MSKPFEMFWLFSFTNPRWKFKRVPSINEASLCYGIFLVTVPSFLLRVIFPSSDTAQVYIVIFTVTLAYWVMGGQHFPGVLKSRTFTPWSVIKRQMVAMVHLFMIGLIVSYYETPWLLQPGMSVDSVWQLLWFGTELLWRVLLIVGAVRLMIWLIRYSTREPRQQTAA